MPNNEHSTAAKLIALVSAYPNYQVRFVNMGNWQTGFDVQKSTLSFRQVMIDDYAKILTVVYDQSGPQYA